MTSPLHVLMVAPDAPPKSTAEAIQVRHILRELDKRVTGTLVTTITPKTSGWVRHDTSLALELQHFETQQLALPLHRLTSRLLLSHRLSRFHIPDSQFWVTFMARPILRALKTAPDILYSRSSPMSAALLSCKLKQALNIPWIMHLSDPWADNPDQPSHPRNSAYEAMCFEQADKIAFTTEGQAAYYRQKYPAFAEKYFITPNVMASSSPTPARQAAISDPHLHIVYAGALYGKRSPAPLLEAISLLRASQPEVLTKLTIDVYGNAQPDALRLLTSAPEVIHYHGPVPFSTATSKQQEADSVLAIEADGAHPLYKSFLSSKVVECLALGKPLLAITPEGSETTRLCNEGYGWAIPPSQPQQLADRLADLTARLTELRSTPPKAPPERYSASLVCDMLVTEMKQLVSKRKNTV